MTISARPKVATLHRTRKSVEAFVRFWTRVSTWFAPKNHWRRYRVAPRANPAAFRDDMLREIQLDLRRAGLVASRRIPGQSTL